MAPDGGVVVLGNYRGGNIFLAKFDPNGTRLWDLTWEIPDSEEQLFSRWRVSDIGDEWDHLCHRQRVQRSRR